MRHTRLVKGVSTLAVAMLDGNSDSKQASALAGIVMAMRIASRPMPAAPARSATRHLLVYVVDLGRASGKEGHLLSS